jgi:hypothetical protein
MELVPISSLRNVVFNKNRAMNNTQGVSNYAKLFGIPNEDMRLLKLLIGGSVLLVLKEIYRTPFVKIWIGFSCLRLGNSGRVV